MNAHRALIVFAQVQHLVHRLQRINVGRMPCVHNISVSGNQIAGAAMFVFGVLALYAEILHFQAADGSAHPAILVAVIVDAAELANFPANGHAFEDVIFVNQVARVAALGEEKVGFQGFRADRVMQDVVLNVFQCEVAIRISRRDS